MPQLTIRHRRGRFASGRLFGQRSQLPYLVFVDGLYAGVMRGDEMRLELPAGKYVLRIQFGGRIPFGKRGKSIDLSVSAEASVAVPSRGEVIATFRDRERVWNLLFTVDLVAWVASLFVIFPPAYKVISDAFFVIWLVRLLLVRKRYYKIVCESKP